MIWLVVPRGQGGPERGWHAVTVIRLAFRLLDSEKPEKGPMYEGGRALGQMQGFENVVWLCFQQGQISEMEIHRTSEALHKLEHGT